MEEQDLLHLTLLGYILVKVPAVKFYGMEVCIFLFVQTFISAKLIFHGAVKKRIWKSVPLN